VVVRGRRLGGARFRRQHPIGPYILDFYCDDARLAVEIDGDGHLHPDQSAHDGRRTEWLNVRGITVYRIAARDVLSNLEGVLESIKQRVRVPPPPPLRGPPPYGGGLERHGVSER
jgi:very-short-patch-repair endonuclease